MHAQKNTNLPPPFKKNVGEFSEYKSEEWGINRKWQDKKSKRISQKNNRGDRKGESQDSPELPDRVVTSEDIPDNSACRWTGSGKHRHHPNACCCRFFLKNNLFFTKSASWRMTAGPLALLVLFPGWAFVCINFLQDNAKISSLYFSPILCQSVYVSNSKHMCQTPSTGLRHPSFNHCRIWLHHRVQKTVS